MPVTVRVDLWSLDVRQRAPGMHYRKHQARMAARVVFQQTVEEKRAAQPACCAGTPPRPRARVAYCEPQGVKLVSLLGLQLLAATGKLETSVSNVQRAFVA